MIMDNFQLIILIVTVIGSMLAHGKIVLGRISALEGRMLALENRMSALENRVSALEIRVSHLDGMFEGFRAAGLVPSGTVKEPTGTA